MNRIKGFCQIFSRMKNLNFFIHLLFSLKYHVYLLCKIEKVILCTLHNAIIFLKFLVLVTYIYIYTYIKKKGRKQKDLEESKMSNRDRIEKYLKKNKKELKKNKKEKESPNRKGK